MAQSRFEIRITKRQIWYYFSLTDRLTGAVHYTGKGYNSKGSAKEAAYLLANSLSEEIELETYDLGPEI